MNILTKSPRRIMLPYQLRWADDASRWKFGLMARQTGKDFCAAEEGVRDCFKHERKGSKTTWLIAAPSERQSLLSLAKWKEWTEVYKLAIKDIREQRDGPEALLQSVTITFPGGSQVIAVPGRPDTVRGYSANVLLTEFAFFENPGATWRAIIPAVTNPMRGGEKKVRLITTPNGIGNKAHDIWVKNYKPQVPESEPTPPITTAEQTPRIQTDEHRLGLEDINPIIAKLRRAMAPVPENQFSAPVPVCDKLNFKVEQASGLSQRASRPVPPGQRPAGTGETPVPPKANPWSCHFVDIYTAVRDGLKVNIEELKAAVDDPEGWAQEFECQFMDAQSVLLPYELIATCESFEATTAVPAEYWMANQPFDIDLGIDFGRKRDMTVCWAVSRLGDVAHTVEILELSNMSTPDQIAILKPRLKKARRVCIDYTGAGIGMGDYLVQQYKEWKPDANRFGKIELCVFTSLLKVGLLTKLRMAFENKTVRVPISRMVREDLHSMNRVITPSGGVSFRAPHSADGHADRCTALALALRASQQEGPCGKVFIFPQFERRTNTSLFQ